MQRESNFTQTGSYAISKIFVSLVQIFLVASSLSALTFLINLAVK